MVMNRVDNLIKNDTTKYLPVENMKAKFLSDVYDIFDPQEMPIQQSRELLNELKLAKSKNSLIFVIIDDCAGLSQLISSNNFCVILVDLKGDRNLLETLVEWESTPDNAVYLVCGIASQFPRVLGHLNLHRDFFYQIKRPVLMAVSEYEIREIQKHAPDPYRYRSRTYNLKAKGKSVAEP